MKNYRIHLLRHGKTLANEQGRFVGRTDVPLSEDGIAQLRDLSRNYEYPGVQKVYSSPLMRCVQTAEIFYPAFEPVTIEGLREYDFGKYENKTAAELVDDTGFMEWIKNGTAADTMESMYDFEQRIKIGFESVLKDMMANKLSSAAIITHGGVIMTLLAALGIPKRNPKLWITDNGHGYTVATSAQLWQQGNLVEVFDPLPYDAMDNATVKEYNLIDLVEDETGESFSG